MKDAPRAATPDSTAKKPGGRQRQASSAKAKPVATKRGTKRNSPEESPKSHKRQKRGKSVESPLSELSESSAGVKPTKRQRNPTRSRDSRSKESAVSPASDSNEDVEGTDSDGRANGADLVDPREVRKEEEEVGSESEMSVLIDEEPVPKKRRQKSSSGPTPKKAVKTKSEKSSKPKEDSNLDPQQAEIKRLQSWLLKCGIRKMWHKELAPYDTPKAKINHLKDMLKNAGMDGRYSAEKAKQIKDQREFKADLEAVQEGAKKWGQSDESEESDRSERKPKRRLAKGLKELDFLADDDDGEETD